MQQTDLSAYNNYPYQPGGSVFKRVLWLYTNALLFKTSLLPTNALKIFVLRVFGASIGQGVVIRHQVNIKYPWLLTIGDNSWIGEGVWIDNLVMVTIGKNVCLSQGAMLETGSHNYKKTSFDLITRPIILEDGVWIGCKAIVNQGVTVASHAVLAAGSVANQNMEAYFIYQGNPAAKTKKRVIV